MDMPGTFKKLQQVFTTARTDSQFAEELARNPRKALAASGLDLTRLEILAVLDIVGEGQKPGLSEKLDELRSEWQAIRGARK